MTLRGFQFQDPLWLWLLAALPAVWLAAGFSAAVSLPRARRICTILRSVGCILVLAALARPVWIGLSDPAVRTNVAILSDRSLSVGQSADLAQQEAEYSSSLGSLGPVHRIEFATKAWMPGEPPPALEGTNIEAALTQSETVLGPDPGVILLMSDGRSTSGDAVKAATKLRAEGHTVHVVARGVRRQAGPRIVGVEPSANPRMGQAAIFFVHVRTDVEQDYELRLLDGKGTEVDRLPGPEARDAVVAMRCMPTDTGFQNYRVLMVAKDPHQFPSEQTIATAPIFIEGPHRALVIDTSPDEVASLCKALSDSGLRLETASLGGASYSYDELVQYDLVILSDCSTIDDHLQSDLVRYVEESGGGLVFVGGRNVRTVAWHGSVLEEALPIEFLPEKVRAEQSRRAVHVCFVLDKSGSMVSALGATSLGQVSKLDMVKAAVQQSVAELPPEALVSVVVFDGATTVLADAVPVAQWGAVSDLVDQLAADGGTVMDPAFESGLDLLSKGERRYMILLTDGQTAVSRGDPKQRWDELIERLRGLDVSLTTIALGTDADRDLLAYIAANAAGTSYECNDASEVPTIFIREAKSIRQTARTAALPFRPISGEFVTMLRGMRAESFPHLQDALSSRRKPLSQAVLLADKGEPLLSIWRQGLGTVVAFTSDAKSVWANNWLSWGSFGRFWHQVASWALRPKNRVHADVRTLMNGTDLRVFVSVTDDAGNPVDHLEGTGALLADSSSAENRSVQLQWREIRPGVYEANATMPPSGNHLCRMQLVQGHTAVFTHSLLVSASASAEMADTGPDLAMLHSIAEAGGGLLNPTPSQVIESVQKRVLTHNRTLKTQEWWPFCVLVAIFVWMLDVTTRRVLSLRRLSPV